MRLRSFSWSRFLTRLEKTLPYDVRVVSVSLAKGKAKKPARRDLDPTRPSWSPSRSCRAIPTASRS
ncbi:MAG: hypothetical protein IPP07_00875 [Holophagales bacterium]|nr:hypothetical protein [Holophagales bacterium]